MAIVLPFRFQPGMLVVHEITKAPRVGIICVPDESEIPGGQFESLSTTHMLQQNTYDKRTGMVIRSVPLMIIGNREDSVLQNTPFRPS